MTSLSSFDISYGIEEYTRDTTGEGTSTMGGNNISVDMKEKSKKSIIILVPCAYQYMYQYM